MTVFEQLVSLKQIRTTKLEKELVRIYDADSQESAEGSTDPSVKEEHESDIG